MKKALFTLSALLTSVYAVAAQPLTVTNPAQVNATPLLSLISLAQEIVTRLVPFAIGIAVLAFFWYLIQFITKGGSSAEAKGASVKGMGLSILALFVMVSIWGIVGFLGSISGIGQGGSVPAPRVPGTQ